MLNAQKSVRAISDLPCTYFGKIYVSALWLTMHNGHAHYA